MDRTREKIGRSSKIPKINLLYYKNVLDLVMETFFTEFNDFFTRSEEKTYVFSSSISRSGLKKILRDLILSTVKKVVLEAEDSCCSYWFLIGGCYPKNNLILKFRDPSGYFPAKLAKFIEEKPTIRWILIEKDIKLDFELLNELFSELFSELCTKKLKLEKQLSNVIFISHKNLDCYMVFKILKWIYGKTACVNVYKKNGLVDKKLPLVAINDLVSRYIHNKQALNKSKDFKYCALEVKQQVEELFTSSKLVQ